MAPPKWTVFDGLDDAEDDALNTDAQTGATDNTIGGERDYEHSQTDGEGAETAESAAGEAGSDEKQGDDPKEGDGDKPDKKGMLTCAGALCTCTNAVSPAPIPLNVTTQERYTINDPDGTLKYLATDSETDKTSLHFGLCRFPDPSKPVLCNAQLVWKDFYESIVLSNGAHPLLQNSTASCTVGQGTVAFKTSGQQKTVTPEEVESANTAGWQAENPVADTGDVEMEGDETEGDQKGVGVVAIRAKTAGPYPVGTTLAFEVTKLNKPRKECTKEQLQGINWMAYDADLKPYAQAIDGGEETDIRFKKAGRYTVEAYGGSPGADSKDAKTKKQSATVTLTLEENKLAGVKRVGSSGGAAYRFTEPAVYEVSSLFPTDQMPLPRRQTLEVVVWQLVKKGGTGEPVLLSAGTRATVTCTGPCEYIVQATLGDTTQQTGLMKAIKNAVTAVTVNPKSCRPGEEVKLKAVFRIDPPLPAELALLKWQCKDGKGMEHTEGFAPGMQVQRLRLKPVGPYKVWAFVNTPAQKVVAEFEVMQPRVKSVQWLYADKETKKKITGWEEENYANIIFDAAQGLDAEVTVGVVRAGVFSALMAPLAFKVDGDNENRLRFPVSKSAYGSRLQEGDFISVRVRCTTVGQTISLEGAQMLMLQFTTKEALTGIAFYKGKKRVNQAHYGEALRCRVYGRNLSAGRTRGVLVQLMRLESSLGGPYALRKGVVAGTYRVVLDERGYGEFDFILDPGTMVENKMPLHKFYAHIQEIDIGGGAAALDVSVGEVGREMLIVQVPVKVGIGAPSPAEIGKEDGENSSEGICECEAKVRAFMRMLRVGENTVGEAGYTRMFGGGNFTDLSTHPQKIIKGSSAAGAYQIMGYTYKWLNGMKLEWEGGFLVATKIYEEPHDYIKQYSVKSYSPADQDLLCVIILRHKLDGIIDLIIHDNLKKAIHDYGSAEWASLPYENDMSRHLYKGKPQPVTKLATVLKDYARFYEEEKLGITDLHLEKGFLDLVGVKCCKEKLADKHPTIACDNAKCIGSEDLFDNPTISDQSGNKNKNRFKRVQRIKKDGTSYYHTGVDILAVSSTPVHALLCGTVVNIESKFKPNQWAENSYGNFIVIKSRGNDGNMVFIKYCHFDSVDVAKGQEIVHGELIGKSGSTGNAGSVFSGEKLVHGIYPKFRHVHVEASRKGTFKGADRIEPEDFMKTKFDNLGNKIK